MIGVAGALHAQNGSGFTPTQDKSTDRWGVVDADGRQIVPAEYDRIASAGENTAVGFKGTDGAAYILGTQGRVKRVEHNAYYQAWRTALKDIEIKDKELIVRVLDMYQDPVERLVEMQNMEATYRDLVEVRTKAVQVLIR